jgi:Ca2+-binding RTX toxin-like protein
MAASALHRGGLVALATGLLIIATAAVMPRGAGAAVTSSYDPGTVTLFAVGDSAPDAVGITCVAGNAKVNGADPGTGPVPCADIRYVTINTGAGSDSIDTTGVSTAAGFIPLCNGCNPAGIFVRSGDGADRFTDGPSTSEFVGGDGNDVASGGGDSEEMFGGHGKDVLRGGADRDFLFGGRGRDNLVGGPGSDKANGGRDSDRCRAEHLLNCER